MSDASRQLFGETVEDAIDQIESGDGYWGVVGASTAKNVILEALEPIADLLAACWYEFRLQGYNWVTADTPFDRALKALPENVRKTLDQLTEETHRERRID